MVRHHFCIFIIHIKIYNYLLRCCAKKVNFLKIYMIYIIYKKINIIGFYVPKTKYCLIILFSLLVSSLLISSDLLSIYISTKLQFLNILNSILDYSVNINNLTEYNFINNILNINNNT